MHNLNTKWRNYYESMLEDCQIDYDTIKNMFINICQINYIDIEILMSILRIIY